LLGEPWNEVLGWRVGTIGICIEVLWDTVRAHHAFQEYRKETKWSRAEYASIVLGNALSMKKHHNKSVDIAMQP